ncbi:MAG: hypothetical protein QOD76_662 [Solirubrobacteraceae bacterium]|jgi:ubiquinone/menaquinone biosynthesis C-methylase UbiE|nr:hypothetical protein [Solirubrobacteraceae bacterium]
MTPRSPVATEQVQEFFDSEARRYADAYTSPTPDGYAQRMRNAAVRRLLGPGSGALLDVGMGPGVLAAELTGLGWTVSGVDISAAMVELARRRLPGAGERFQVARIEALPFAEASFDAVCAMGVIEYASDQSRAVSELARVLKRGGVGVLSLPNRTSLPVLWNTLILYPLMRAAKRVRPFGRRAPLRRRLPDTPARFAQQVSSLGFVVEAVAYANYQVLPAPFGQLFGRTSVTFARWLEQRGALPGTLAATQVVFRVRLVGPRGGAAIR